MTPNVRVAQTVTVLALQIKSLQQCSCSTPHWHTTYLHDACSDSDDPTARAGRYSFIYSRLAGLPGMAQTIIGWRRRHSPVSWVAAWRSGVTTAAHSALETSMPAWSNDGPVQNICDGLHDSFSCGHIGHWWAHLGNCLCSRLCTETIVGNLP